MSDQLHVSHSSGISSPVNSWTITHQYSCVSQQESKSNLLIIHEGSFVFLEESRVESDQLHVATGCRVVVTSHLLPVLGRYLTNSLVDLNTRNANLLL